MISAPLSIELITFWRKSDIFRMRKTISDYLIEGDGRK